MTPIDKSCWSLLASLAIASIMSCGKPAGPGASFKPSTTPDLSPPKGGAPVGVLPSLVVSGQVVAFKATPTAAGPRPWPDTVGTLPSHVTAGQTAVYVPGGGQETASRMPPARVATP